MSELFASLMRAITGHEAYAAGIILLAMMWIGLVINKFQENKD